MRVIFWLMLLVVQKIQTMLMVMPGAIYAKDQSILKMLILKAFNAVLSANTMSVLIVSMKKDGQALSGLDIK